MEKPIYSLTCNDKSFGREAEWRSIERWSLHTLREYVHIPGETNMSRPMAEAKSKHPVPRQGASWYTVGGKSPGPHGSLRNGHLFQKPMGFSSKRASWDSGGGVVVVFIVFNSNRYEWLMQEKWLESVKRSWWPIKQPKLQLF